MHSLGIVGGGFAGLSTLAALVRHAHEPLQITIYNPDMAMGRGKAYSTQDPHHLLNVRAGAMGAHAGQDDDFYAWLMENKLEYQAADFVPRAVYGRYLDYVLAETLVQAQKKDIRIFAVHEKVTEVTTQDGKLVVKTAVETKIHDGVILACGNDRPRLPLLGDKVSSHAGWWRHPYLAERWPNIRHAGHVIIIGSGLSMVDALVTLRRERYDGDITVVSRHGQHPLSHADVSQPCIWHKEEIVEIDRPSQVLRHIRRKVAETGADWRDALDGLRPFANQIWQSFSPQDRMRAQIHMSLWNIFRHRIPAVMHELIRDLEKEGQLRRVSGRVERVEAMGSSLNVYTSAGVKEGQIVINCMGYDYRVTPEDKGLLAGLVRSGMVTLAEGYPQPLDDTLRLNAVYPLYAVGPLLQGHLIESTAVREIRAQADQAAAALLKAL